MAVAYSRGGLPEPRGQGNRQFFQLGGSRGQESIVGINGVPDTGGGTGTVTSVTLTQPAAGLTITNTGVAQTPAATSTFALSKRLITPSDSSLAL